MLIFHRNNLQKSSFKVGDTVWVSSKEQIAETLDSQNKHEGCLFMDQMWDYCDQKFRIIRVVNYLFDEKRLKMHKSKTPLYILEGLICHGKIDSFKTRCDHSCDFFWHPAWLQTDFFTNEKPAKKNCQLAELDDLLKPNSRLSEILQTRIKWIWAMKKELIYIKNTLSHKLQKNQNFKQVQASPTCNDEIKAGDWVKVRSADEIRGILDVRGGTRGCIFTPEMYARCGQTYKVYKQIEHFYDEVKERECKCRDIFLLEGAFCSGRRKAFPKPCDRKCFQFWHKGWLEKIET